MLPELARHFDGVDTGGLPPCSLVTGSMNGAVVRAAKRYSEFVADPAAERPRLHGSKMMGVRWLAAADEACLLSDIAQMLPAAIPTRGSNREDTLVDASGLLASSPRSLRLILRGHLGDHSSLTCGNVVYNGR